MALSGFGLALGHRQNAASHDLGDERSGVEHDAEDDGGITLGEVQASVAGVDEVAALFEVGSDRVDGPTVTVVAELVGCELEEVTGRVDQPAASAGPDAPDEERSEESADAGEDHAEPVVVGQLGEAGWRTATVQEATDPVEGKPDRKNGECDLHDRLGDALDDVGQGVEDAADPAEHGVQEPADEAKDGNDAEHGAVGVGLGTGGVLDSLLSFADEIADNRTDEKEDRPLVEAVGDEDSRDRQALVR
ncbi:hypothetical protein GQR58_029852 [Nymphon striatum]|nr:hypothetical protein GQR58_029852 [Nymphon striatum]